MSYESAKSNLQVVIDKGVKNFIIYPYGARGKEVKKVLNNEFGIQEKYIVDNGQAGENGILGLDDLKQINITEMTILLACDNEIIYSEIRQQLKDAVGMKQVIDVYPYSIFREDSSESKRWVRAESLQMAAREIYSNNVQGAVAEVGVFRGDFARVMGRFFSDRTLYLFDTFEGFSDKDITEQEEIDTGAFRRRCTYKDTSVDIVLDKIGRHIDAVVRKGYFPDTAKGLENEKFAFVNLDADLYKPTISGLQFFYSRLNRGGYIFIHDFIGCAGANRAVLEFCRAEHIGYVCLPDAPCHTAVIAKPL